MSIKRIFDFAHYALEKYPKDALVPKFALLNAFNSGKIAGKEIMILQLEQIALNYSRTLEGEKAKEMLKYLKSDLVMEITDENGNKNQPSGPGKPQIQEDDAAPSPMRSQEETTELATPPGRSNTDATPPQRRPGKSLQVEKPAQIQ